ncbi:protocatechuate 3,4-dioxygenase subunit alpha [Kluyvera intermedia]|jgi:protocatechuate 3,4-dioxygenase alpha subunit|uniref:Protocatechuate 3,4-dioxygenase subunit alpha n=1 Tax=Kluyvera intermedia TaxID=61648 RepID=A0ABX6DMJ8_KLUIN|nr:protocatechuate 3,4-dioxygenase subunit alpha [Kluyvera intermedia]QGH30017.1 protocatechuate 3,4-dioxygenase subunit alpha [Kluyvera intermedia]QGH38999.1 protocatechuate 3,4-dioxygenase subunit alpha [Kluyvera intermedia]WQD31758.1 protocatechuate 3,4-dioxygenase subunit alpha [Kluyvera intermedia]VDZ83153.1 Protocatechuate 3,4-dioxygenase alpha chain [Kluyvera intermedia]
MKDYLPETASQTAGPYVHIGLAPDAAGFHIFEKNFGSTLTNSHTSGEHIAIEGRVFDGSGTPVRDVLIEIWQANAEGRYNHIADQQQEKPLDEDFRGWGRACSNFDSGVWRFDTIKPGQVTGRDGRMMAPHVNLWIVARGINIGLNTRMYFSDEQDANANDPVLNIIEWEVRRQTLIGRRETRGNETVYCFDIYLQGEHETVFFDV